MKEKEFAYITDFSSNVYKTILVAEARISTTSSPRSSLSAMLLALKSLLFFCSDIFEPLPAEILWVALSWPPRKATVFARLTRWQLVLRVTSINNVNTQSRDKQQSLILLFKCIRNIGLKYIRDSFSIRETSYNLRGNGVNLCVPKFNLNFMRNSFTHQRAQLWNKLPVDVKLADNVHIFKTKLRSTQL